MTTKTVTAKPKTKTAALKQMMQAPIGGTKTEAANVAPKVAKVQEQKGKARKPSLYYFQMTPAGAYLRAYFVAFITAQIGGLVVGKSFKLWPSANIRGHLDTGKVARKDGAYALTVQGVNYFKDPAQEADKDLLAKFLKAIKSGAKPDIYKHEMSGMK